MPTTSTTKSAKTVFDPDYANVKCHKKIRVGNKFKSQSLLNLKINLRMKMWFNEYVVLEIEVYSMSFGYWTCHDVIECDINVLSYIVNVFAYICNVTTYA